MHVSVTLRVAPHQKRKRLSDDGLRQEADRLMDGLGRADRVGPVRDVAVASDADTGLIRVTATVVARDEQAAVDALTSFFRKVADRDSPGPAEDPIGHVILEKHGDQLDLPEEPNSPSPAEILA